VSSREKSVKLVSPPRQGRAVNGQASANKALKKTLTQLRGRYRGLLETAPDAMVVVNESGAIVLLNLQAEKQFGYRRDELFGRRVTDIIPAGFAERLIADDLRAAEDALTRQIGTGIELLGRRKDGSEFPIEITLSPFRNAEGILVTAAIRNISMRKDVERHLQQVRFLSEHDALTGLDNRSSLVEKLDEALTRLPYRGGRFAVHFIDVDRFKEVNNSLGHDGGDFLLRTVAERLRESTRLEDIVARVGGDEFVVIQAHVHGENDAESFARRLAHALSVPMKLNEAAITFTVSVGIALAPENGNDPERLLKSADLALYKSKSDGGNCIRFFQTEMDAALLGRIALEKSIRNAVLHDSFELHYQPVFRVSDRSIVGFEALLRLPASDGKLIPPLIFIPVAEDLRLIDKIGEWTLRHACRTAALWPEHLTIAVNLSPAQFTAGGVSAIVAAALKEAGIAPHRLELEITETLLLADSEIVMAELRALKALGVAIVMDDFGVGYSSLSYLWRFPFDKIKIDRGFMEGFSDSSHSARTVVKAIIGLGRELNMGVTVEGVETAEQAAFLEQADGDQAQGMFFGHPLPADEIAAGILQNFGNGKNRSVATIRDGGVRDNTGYALGAQ
jgi:diguanylate cyclase (GGDEF)-like protein/PAS domain S-box-containing protein